MITVVISSYKYGHLAAHCIESILGQSELPERIMFVDDCAGDCSHIHKHYPEIEYYENPENYGTVKNFQNMLDKVTGKYCMFIGADNWLRSDAISLMTNALQNLPDVVTYDMILTGELKETRVPHHKEEMVPYIGDYYWDRMLKHHGSMLYRTELAKSVGGYSIYKEGLHQTLEDLSLWNKMIQANAKVTHIKQGLLYYRHHRENFNKY